MVAKSKAMPPAPAKPSARRMMAGNEAAPGGDGGRKNYLKPTPDAPGTMPPASKVPAKKIGTDSHPSRPMLTAGTGPSPGGGSVASRNYHKPTPDFKSGSLFKHSRNPQGV